MENLYYFEYRKHWFLNKEKKNVSVLTLYGREMWKVSWKIFKILSVCYFQFLLKNYKNCFDNYQNNEKKASRIPILTQIKETNPYI